MRELDIKRRVPPPGLFGRSDLYREVVVGVVVVVVVVGGGGGGGGGVGVV